MQIEERIKHLFSLRSAIADINIQKSELQRQYDEEEYLLIVDMQEAGLTKGGTDDGTVSIKVESYPKIEDMNAFVQWCADNGKAEMLQKRVSKAVFDEFYKNENEYPDGVDTYDKTVVSLRKR